MKSEKFEEIINGLSLKKEEWVLLSDVDSIILKNGVGIYPNWRHLRFLISGNEIFVQHGKSEPYGGRLSGMYSLNWDNTGLTFNPGSLVLSDNISKKFREPKTGDIIRAASGNNKCIIEVMISRVAYAMNGSFIDFVPALPKISGEYRFSFYDPSMYDVKTCIHGTEEEGIYMKFIANSGKTHKKYGVFHEKINIKDINEINLKLKTDKTYSLM